MKFLLVGDPHVKKSDREEFAKAIVWIAGLCKKYNATPFFLGDQYNDFGIARIEVMEFWDAAFKMMMHQNIGKPIALVGNHDINGDASASAMTVHNTLAFVIDRHGSQIGDIKDGVFGIGYTRDNKEFIKKVNEYAALGAKIIFCHAEIEGSQYDNGFYAPNGVPLAELPKNIQFISGHIHKQQEYANIWYPGTMRHLTRSDIGENKGVWLYDTHEQKKAFFATPVEVSEPYRQIEVIEGQPIPTVTDSTRNFVDVRGSEDFIQKVCKKLPESVKVRTFPNQVASVIDIKESEGIPTAFRKYAQHYVTDKVLSAEMTQKVLTEIYSKCPSLKVGADSGS